MTLEAFGLVPHQTKALAVGQRFDRLTVVAIGKRPGTYDYRVVYQCDCGGRGLATISGLKLGQWKSCGCWSKERTRKHGLWGTRLYVVWQHMMSRCHDSSSSRYADYGGRGVKVCERWHDPVAFFEDVQGDYRPGLLIDRIDNDGDYTLANVRWVPNAAQQRNKRNNINVTLNGRTQVLKDWCAELGLNYHSVYYRIREKGMDPELALSTPFVAARRLLSSPPT